MFPKAVEFTIEGLAKAVEAALAAGAVDSVNGRIRAVPDVRTLRYYTMLGLLDRPARMHGRTAFYGRRHLLQLVAIKRLQAAGLPLAQVQLRLLNASDDELAHLAQLPAEIEEAPVPSPESAKSEPDRVYWKTPPRAPVETGATAATSESLQQARHPTFLGVPLSDDASLLFQAVRPLDEEDVAALHAAARPLLETLRHRRLLP